MSPGDCRAACCPDVVTLLYCTDAPIGNPARRSYSVRSSSLQGNKARDKTMWPTRDKHGSVWGDQWGRTSGGFYSVLNSGQTWCQVIARGALQSELAVMCPLLPHILGYIFCPKNDFKSRDAGFFFHEIFNQTLSPFCMGKRGVHFAGASCTWECVNSSSAWPVWYPVGQSRIFLSRDHEHWQKKRETETRTVNEKTWIWTQQQNRRNHGPFTPTELDRRDFLSK